MYRQKDKQFIAILQNIRIGRYDNACMQLNKLMYDVAFVVCITFSHVCIIKKLLNVTQSSLLGVHCLLLNYFKVQRSSP